MSEERICEMNRERLLEARPVYSHDPLELRGETPEGGEIIVDLDADPEYLKEAGIHDIHDFAEKGGC